jgi:pimeloyl-ACP methyl ester carboxylesterase
MEKIKKAADERLLTRFKRNEVVINGAKVSYWEKNHRRKSVIVFLHGFPGSHKGLVAMASQFPKHRLLIPDLPACGASEPLRKGHSLRRYAAWLAEYLAALSIDRTTIVGHSFGARVALRFSIDHPKKVEHLVLISPVMTVDSFIGKLATTYYRFSDMLPDYLQNAWSNNTLYRNIGNAIIYKSSSPKRQKYFVGVDAKDAKDIDGHDEVRVFNDFYRHPSIRMDKKFNVKTLLIVGDKDEIATPASVEVLFKRFTNAEMKIMKKAGHHITLERPGALGTVIHAWL